MADEMKKPVLAGLLEGTAEPDATEPDTDDAAVTAAGAVREALDSGSDEDLAKALSGFMKIGG